MTIINPIEELIRDPEVTEIMVNASDDVWVERQGRIEPTGVKFLDEEHVPRTIERLVSQDGRGCDRAYRTTCLHGSPPTSLPSYIATALRGCRTTRIQSYTPTIRQASSRTKGCPKWHPAV